MLKKVIQDKKNWHDHQKRVKHLPHDYQVVYYEIQKYFFKVGTEVSDSENKILSEIVDLFEQGVLANKAVLEVTGQDVALFVDELINSNK